MARSASEIRELFLRFFEAKGHQIVASASLVPEGDPTLLFTNAGMVPFKNTFLGSETRDYVRAVTSQKCLRVSGKHNDLENVGHTPRHNTFFEMLGNFSFGDYFKLEAIEYSWELLTEHFEIDPARLVASVFREDDEAYGLWREKIVLPAEKIFRLDEDENFWSMGETGPCGPCAEIHIDFGVNSQCTSDSCDPSCDCGRWLEIWNLVFMQFDRDAAGNMTPLPKPSIDTGASLERLASVLQGVPSNFDTDLFRGIMDRIQRVSGVARGEDPERDVSMNVIADHARALVFLIGDGVLPGNEGRGYVLRRLLRRAARHGVLLGVERPFLFDVGDAVIDEMAAAYPELRDRRAYITGRIQREEERFLETLSKGLALLEEDIAALEKSGSKMLPGEAVFKLYDTFGFPVDLTADILSGRNLEIDEAGFNAAMTAQRQRARAAWKGSGDERVAEIYAKLAFDLSTRFTGYSGLSGTSTIRALLVDGESREVANCGESVEIVVDETPFYAESGGQVGDRGTLRASGGAAEISDTQRPALQLVVHRGVVSEGELRIDSEVELAVNADARAATVRNHSGTHLLHAALRAVLGKQAMQKGSLVGPDRLRFDFTHDVAIEDRQIEAIEDLANAWIEQNAPSSVREMSYPEAIEAGAVAIFDEKYGDVVRVVQFGDFSTELCGGTHARATGDIGLLKILSESSIASGVRRIEALTGLGALNHLRNQEKALRSASELLRVTPAEVPARIEKLLEDRRSAEREIEQLRSAQRGATSKDLTRDAREIAGVQVIATRVAGAEAKVLRGMVDDLRSQLSSGIVLLAAEKNGQVSLALGVTRNLTDRFRAGDMIREVAIVVGGKGGGRPDFAQAGGSDPSKIDAAFDRLDALIAGS
ncbi:MAG: alanine--tRNA ligase [Deltaproteobacteria bacterium]|jgi:alanyl-tRNA synthetase|nr:alanine--tRNA ligase [Deltaproteobacteria bacterium]